MATLSSVSLRRSTSPPETGPTMWFMGNVCADTTLQEITASAVLLFTTTDPGSLPTDSQERHMNVASANVTDTLKAVVLIGRSGVSLAREVEASATVCTTQKGGSVRNAELDSTETRRGLTQLQNHANHAAVTQWAPCPFTLPMVLCATLPMETVYANLESAERNVTGVWWDTGAFMSMAVAHVTVQETATLLLGTACMALIWNYTTWMETPVSQSGSSVHMNYFLLSTTQRGASAKSKR